MSTVFQSIPTTEGVRKLGPGEGEKFDIAGVHLTWKVKGEVRGYSFSICEQTLAPGEGVLRPVRSVRAGMPEVNWRRYRNMNDGSTQLKPSNELHP